MPVLPTPRSNSALFGLLLLVVGCASAHALTLDWNTAPWANGSLSNSFDVDPATTGNDVTVTVSGDTAQLGAESTFQQTPAITTNLQGGLPSPEKTLTLLCDLSSNTQSVTVTVNFSAQYTQGVNNVSFSIFDVDYANVNGASGAKFTDEIRSVIGIAPDGSQVAATITASPDNQKSGTGLTQVVDGIATTVDTGTGSGNANVTISFGSTAITSFSFVYGSGASAPSDPTAQHIGIDNISFTPVPELNPAWVAALSCLAAGYLIHRHNVRFRK